MRFCRFFLMKRYRRSVSRFSTTTTLTSGHLRLQPGFRLLSKKPRQGPQARDLKLSSEHRRNDSVGDLGGAPPLPPAVEEEGFPVYCRPVHPGRLWQGEILENLPQWKLTHEGIVASAAYPGPEQEIPEQLEQQAHARFQNRPDRWQKLKRNQMERYQFLQGVTPQEDLLGQGLPALVMDFKDHFTLPTAEVYERLAMGTGRRSRLLSPYLEHMIHRFFHFQSRVALPKDHLTGPAAGA